MHRDLFDTGHQTLCLQGRQRLPETIMDFNLCKKIVKNIYRLIVGKGPSIELLLVALLSDGHVLIEDNPGLGETLIAKSLA